MAEINEIEIKKKTYKESMKQKAVLWKKKQDWQAPGNSD
jgi:hypothetical protein